jgi:hypothetical protein
MSDGASALRALASERVKSVGAESISNFLQTEAWRTMEPDPAKQDELKRREAARKKELDANAEAECKTQRGCAMAIPPLLRPICRASSPN